MQYRIIFSISVLLLVASLTSCAENYELPPIHPDNKQGQKLIFDPEPTPEGLFAGIMNSLYTPGDRRVMICAHRGVETTTLPENSLENISRCIELGIDIVEIDISRTKDGVLVLMHDETLDRTTTGSGKVADKTLAELKTLFLKDANGKITNFRIPTLEATLDLIKGKILIQVDKWPSFVNDILPLLHRKQCLQQSIFRSTSDYYYIKSIFREYLDKIVYIPVIRVESPKADEILASYLSNMPSIPVICFVFAEANHPMLNQVPELKKKYRIWYNAISDNDCAKKGDKIALTNPDAGYGWLIEKGAGIIFTSYPILLNNYLASKK